MSDYLLRFAVTQLWQVTILFLFVLVLSLIFRRRPHLVLLFWVLFLVKCLVPPLVQSPVSPMSVLTPERYSLPTDGAGDAQRESVGLLATRPEGEVSPGNQTVSQSSYSLTDVSSVSIANSLLIVWAAGSTIILTAFVANYVLVRRRVLGESIQLDESHAANAILISLAEELDFASGDARLLLSEASVGPLVFGFLRPSIVLPAEVVDSSISIRPIIAHELCHIWRRDHLLGLIQMAAQVLFWFHPFVWIASSRINRLCEVCCDDDTMRLFDLSSKSYASGLLDVLSLKRVIRPMAVSLGIRPVEITKQRIASIVDGRHPKTRQSQMIVMCVFLCLALPGSGPRWTAKPPAKPKEPVASFSRTNMAEIAQRRVELDFLLGSWNVFGRNGEHGGVSKFAYEKSGKMIREDWIAQDGKTAQGITFFDPGEDCWKMTWVDSTGTIMESAGQWENSVLTLDGLATSRNGMKTRTQTIIKRVDENTLLTSMHIARDGKFVQVSRSRYVRVVE